MEKQLHALTKTSHPPFDRESYMYYSQQFGPPAGSTHSLTHSLTDSLVFLSSSFCFSTSSNYHRATCTQTTWLSTVPSYLTYDSRMHAPCTPLFAHPAKGTFPADMLKYVVVTKQLVPLKIHVLSVIEPKRGRGTCTCTCVL